MYYEGKGVPRNYAEAAAWIKKGAIQGYSRSQFDLGVLYHRGHGVMQNYAEAVRWYREAADQGDPDAQLNLGVMYYESKGVPQDYIQSHMWFNLAAARYSATVAGATSETRNTAVNNRDQVAAKMTPAQIAEAQKLAREWKPREPIVFFTGTNNF